MFIYNDRVKKKHLPFENVENNALTLKKIIKILRITCVHKKKYF